MIILPLNEPVVMIAFLPTNVVKINIIDKFVSSNRTPFTYCQSSRRYPDIVICQQTRIKMSPIDSAVNVIRLE